MDTTVLKDSGCLAVCHQKTNKEMFGTLTRVSVGKKQLNKPNKTILLVGETGAGKTTLVNALFNYSMGVKWQDKVWYQIVEEGEQGPTSDVIVYEIFGSECKTLPYSLTVIDTPGVGDTRGIERDVIISQRLFDLFRSEDGVQKIHAVGVVIKATDTKISERLSYVFDSVMSLFGKDMEKITVALITHSDGTKTEIALQALEYGRFRFVKNKKNQALHFMFNNCQNAALTEETGADLKEAWRVTESGMSQFASFLEKTSPQQLQAMFGWNSRIRLSAYIQNLQEKIQLNELKMKEITQIEEALKKNKKGTEKDEKFSVNVDEVYKVREPIDSEISFLKSAVCCTVCEENCHYPGCTMALDPQHCEVMKYGRCTVCVKKCHTSAHVKDNWRYVTKTREVKRTQEENKQRYKSNNSDIKKNVTILEILEKEMETLTQEKLQLIEDAYQQAVKLEQCVLNVYSVSTYVSLDFLVEKMKEKRDQEKVQKLEEIKSTFQQLNEGAKAMLQFKSLSGLRAICLTFLCPSSPRVLT
ncbi:hypothetical protein XENORESO_019141 [Xenotaenia resolanae]|uniref:Septin-type G domain-containing protein n=1 Tax=Xenotaenia resolanae TaxID=208358 RepID=A0ABV0X8D1_9TELE